MRLLGLLATIALFAAALFAGVARADGDPASDTLVATNAYLPATPPSKTATAGLEKHITAVYSVGDRIKVAVIAARYDLGAIPSPFNKPTPYARFLGEELSTIYIGPLLVVMPGGYGVYDGGRSTAAETSVLATIAKPASRRPDDLTTAASAAVAALLKSGALRSPTSSRPSSRSRAPRPPKMCSRSSTSSTTTAAGLLPHSNSSTATRPSSPSRSQPRRPVSTFP